MSTTASNRVTMNCAVHGVTEATLVLRGGAPRCLRCQADAARRYRNAKTSHPGSPAGSYFRGLQTTQGINTERKILPVSAKVMEWIDGNHERFGKTRSLVLNELLAEAIAKRDPGFDPENL